MSVDAKKEGQSSLVQFADLAAEHGGRLIIRNAQDLGATAAKSLARRGGSRVIFEFA